MISKNFIILLVLLFNVSLAEDCWNYNGENGCKGMEIDYPEEWGKRVFQTPPRGHKNWKPSYQDMNLIVGYVQQKYSSDNSKVTLNFIYKLNTPNLPFYTSLVFKFGDYESRKSSFVIKKEEAGQYKDGLKVSARLVNYIGQIVASLDLDLVYLRWNNPPIYQPSNYENGQKGAIVEFFGWPYDDIAEECEFMHTAGYLGVKVFPPSEHILSYANVEENGQLNPWDRVYQPVSYRLTSRQGTQTQLKAMIDKCRSLGVRVYADAVINHMAGNGNDMSPDHRNQAGGSCVHWGPKNSAAGSPWYTTGFMYGLNEFSGEKPGLEFPAVPYDSLDFHCERSLSSWSDGFILNAGWLVGLTDLNTEREYVRQRIADYITTLLSIGFSGIRIDAAKHISPENISHILAKLKANLGGGDLPEDFIAYLEVLFGGEKDLLLCNSSQDYSYGIPFVNKMKAVGLSDSDIEKIKIWGNDYPKEFPICGYYIIPASRFAIGLDCHDDQFPGSSSRDMGDKGSVLVKAKDVGAHRYFTVQMFTRRDYDWKIKLVLSSYTFKGNAFGYPDGHSDCARCITDECKRLCTNSMPYSKAYDPSSTGYDCTRDGSWKEGVYTRVHRDREIVNAMRGWMGLNELSYDELYGKERSKIKFLEK